ncbi:MAG: glycogen synthase [Acidimicrobiales bacterium]
MRVLFAAAEIAPVARVGGMAEASAGLVKQLRADGIDVTVVLPDYAAYELSNETETKLLLPEWARPGSARSGDLEGVGKVILVQVPWIEKPHPYSDESGQAWPDNDLRFFGFSAAIAAIVNREVPDVLHLNDWHTAATLGLMLDAPPSLLTIHTLGYQGVTNPGWMDELIRRPHHFAWYGGTNPLLGGIRLADRVVTVSPNYAAEVLTEESGMGLHEHLRNLGDRLVGIVNGIDTTEWNPATDELLEENFTIDDLTGKATERARLLNDAGLDPSPDEPLLGMVTRLVEQKGVDLAVDAARFLENMPAKLVILGSGDSELANQLDELVTRFGGRVAFHNGYDIELAHRIFAGSDLLLMPSRFEPCGLAQMQAMAYGTIPVVTDVGGLHDTVIDADRNPGAGTGFVSESVDTAGIVDALYRATRAWSDPARRSAIQRRAMAHDWSWAEPAKQYEALYAELA